MYFLNPVILFGLKRGNTIWRFRMGSPRELVLTLLAAVKTFNNSRQEMDIIKTPKVDNVRLLNHASNKKVATGTLYLTATHLIFVDPDGSKETWIMHSHISSVEKLPLTAAGSPLKIRCKTFQTVTFVISRERECHDVYSALLHLSNPEKLEDLYAFSYTPKDENLTRSAGWALFDIRSEYARMGLPSDNWFLNNGNKDYQICDTYPSILFVPASASPAVVVGSSKFRSRGRLPALSFFYKKAKTAICRCSQPLAGINNTRSSEDEGMIQAILNSTPNSSYMYIVDTRPKLNAMANRAAGKGYESTDFYDNVKFQFVGIENIHVMRQSLQKLVEVTSDIPNLTWSALLNGLEGSNWLKHIKAIIDTSVFIAKALVEEQVSVLVHCSDGWDRTAQTCSVASIMLDPYYRTIHGFQVLIEKEWLSFGHKFTHRCGFLQVDPKEVSPVFTQFLECVWQFQEQFPFAFQFNERFLLTMHDHLFSCQFGTFLGDCERERKEHQLSERTYSLWGYMWQNISDYANPLYQEDKNDLIWPDTNPQALKYWRSMYNRYDNVLHPRERVLDSLSSIIDHNDSLHDHIRLLTNRIMMLQRVSKEGKSSSVLNGPQGKRDGSKRVNNEQSTLNHVINTETSSSGDHSCGSSEKAESLPDCTSEQRSSVGYDATCQLERLSITSSIDGSATSYSGVACADSGVGTEISEELKQSLKRQGVTVTDLLEELPGFAVEWKSIRDVIRCSSCSSPIDFLSRKYHCWNCGEVFCKRCINKQCSLPGHYSENLVPVCKTCYKLLRKLK